MGEKSKIGTEGENLACAYLGENGYKIIERNFRKPWGELDVVALAPDKTLAFVEVKTMNNSFSQGLHPEDQLTSAKLHKLQRTARLYAGSHKNFINEEKGWRIDLLCVSCPDDLTRKLKNCDIKHYENI